MLLFTYPGTDTTSAYARSPAPIRFVSPVGGSTEAFSWLVAGVSTYVRGCCGTDPEHASPECEHNLGACLTGTNYSHDEYSGNIPCMGEVGYFEDVSCASKNAYNLERARLIEAGQSIFMLVKADESCAGNICGSCRPNPCPWILDLYINFNGAKVAWTNGVEHEQRDLAAWFATTVMGNTVYQEAASWVGADCSRVGGCCDGQADPCQGAAYDGLAQNYGQNGYHYSCESSDSGSSFEYGICAYDCQLGYSITTNIDVKFWFNISDEDEEAAKGETQPEMCR